jgi:hypothetical protein
VLEVGGRRQPNREPGASAVMKVDPLGDNPHRVLR